MGKKKVKATLSFDSDIYRNFQKYCQENAIMLSRKIEIIMEKIMKEKKKKLSFVLFFVGILLIMINFASAVQIASDDFECGAFNCGSGWSGTWSVSGDCIVTSLDTPRGGFHMRGQEDASGTCIADRNFDNSAYTFSNVSFWAKSDVLETGDFCRYYYYNGSSYFLLLEMTNGDDDNTYRQYNFSVSSYGLFVSAGIRMRQFGVGSDNCYIDDINISGFSAGAGDTTPPVVNLQSPANGTSITNSVIFFKADFSDNVNVSNATLHIWNSTSLVGTNFTALGNSSISTNLSFNLPREGTYFWNYLAYDNSTNSAFNSTNFTLIYSIPDTNPPNVTNLIPTANSNFSIEQIIEIASDVVDNKGISEVKANVTFPNGTINQITLNIVGTGPKYNNSFTIPSLIGRYNITFIANDTSNNKNDTEKTFFNTQDAISPLINFVFPTEINGANLSQSFIRYNATANDTNLQTIIIRIYNSTGNLINSSSSVTSPLQGNFSDLTDGIYKINATANDTSGNSNSTETRTIILDSTFPKISYGSGTENDGVGVSRNWIYVNVTVTETNEANITFRLFNSTTNVNTTTFTTPARTINWTNLQDGTYKFNVTVYDSAGNINSTETRIITLDTTPPTWLTEPQNQTNNESEAFSYSIEATDNAAISSYFINDNVNFTINQSGTIKNNTKLNITTYILNISVNDTSNNILSKVISIRVNEINEPPTINSNKTIVNNTEKIPVFGDEFFIQVNASDSENDALVLNYTLIAPNGTKVIENIQGVKFIINNHTIFNSSSYKIDDYGFWNWSYAVSDGINSVYRNGTFRVYSDIFIFPNEFIATPDPKNQTLIWNLSLYHLSNEEYALNFTHELNNTYFTLTFTNNSAIVSKRTYNESNLFKNQITITIADNVQEGVIYNGNITIKRQEDNKSFILPITIGINPPSGNVDAFDLTNNKCLGSNCDFDIKMENDESRVFQWIVKNTGNNSLLTCKPSITGFNISNFGVFSDNDFSLNISESLTLSLNINQPSINTYYGQLEITCQSTSLGYNSSLGAESDNAPKIKMLVVADTGSVSPPPTSGGGGGGGQIGTIIVQPQKIVSINFSKIEEIFMRRGTSATFSLEVVNDGTTFLNGCFLTFKGEAGEWFSNNQVKGLSPGEKLTFNSEISIPNEADPRVYTANIIAKCEEIEESSILTINIYRNVFDAEILDYEREGGELIVDYSLKENAGIEHNIIINYSMLDLDGVLRLRGQSTTFLRSKEEKIETIKFTLPKDSFGEFNFEMDLTDGASTISINKTIFLPSERGLAGLAISDNVRRGLSLAAAILVFAFVLYIVMKFIYSHHKRIKKIGKIGIRQKRKLIELDL